MIRIIIIFLIINLTQSFMNMNMNPNNLNNYSYKILNKEQIQLIKKIIKNKSTTNEMREKINYILYNYYKPFAIKKSLSFKYFHKNKCNNIHISELINYSYEGLYKAIIKYNGNSDFIKFINIFIHGNLYRCMTESQTFNILPKSYRRRKNYSRLLEKNNNVKKYNQNNIKINLVGHKTWILENNLSKSYISNIDNIIDLEFYKNIWQKIDNYDCIKTVFYYKYDFYLKKIRTNKEISKMLNCSEETVRRRIDKVKQNLINDLILL